jgi:hypothetical protein
VQCQTWGRRSVFVVCLPASARPRPSLLDVDESGLNWIILDISKDVTEFLSRTDPMIVRFILPKRHSRPAQMPVRLATRPALEPAHNRWHRISRLENDVNVVGHDNPAVQRVETTRCFTIQKSVFDDTRYSGFSKPERPAGGTVETFVPRTKRRTTGILRSQNMGTARRHRPGEAPCHKHRGTVGNPMR